MALTLSKVFMRTISQNPSENQTSKSLWGLEEIKEAQEKQQLLEVERQERQANGLADDEYGDGGIPDDQLDDFDLDM